MAFSGFNLFSDVSRNFLNTGSLIDTSSFRDVGSALTVAADNLYGLVPGGTLGSIIRFGLASFGFLVDTVTGERMVFQYNTIPKESGGAEYAEQKTLGRSVPHLHYKGGKARVLELPITFTMREFTRDDVRRNVRWLESLAYPDYNGESEVSLAPHPVVLVQGKLYSRDMWVVRDFNIEWGNALDPITQLPSEATCTLTLMEVATRGKAHGDVIRL